MRPAAAFRERKEVRSFNRIRRANSGRVLSLIALTEAAVAAGYAADKRLAPTQHLFFCIPLNNAILTKHNVRDNEREFFAQDVAVATKIFIPFDPKRLEVGGRSFFIEENQFREHLRELLHIDWQARDAKSKHDIKVLEALSHSPTLDPFIVIEALRAEGIRVEPTFFADSYALLNKASADVFDVFKPLVGMALGKAASADEVSRFIDQVWNVSRTTSENPFLEALQIPRSEWAAVIFAWKALIYYDQVSRGTGERLSQVLRVLQQTVPKGRLSRAVLARIEDLKRELARNLYKLHDGSTGYVQMALKRIVDAIIDETGALAISESLRGIASNISSVGMNVVLFEQVTSYFLHLYPRPSSDQVDPENYISELANLCDIVQLRDKALG